MVKVTYKRAAYKAPPEAHALVKEQADRRGMKLEKLIWRAVVAAMPPDVRRKLARIAKGEKP